MHVWLGTGWTQVEKLKVTYILTCTCLRVCFDVKITVLVTVRYGSDSVSITIFITILLLFSLPFYRAKWNVHFSTPFCYCFHYRFTVQNGTYTSSTPAVQ